MSLNVCKCIHDTGVIPTNRTKKTIHSSRDTNLFSSTFVEHKTWSIFVTPSLHPHKTCDTCFQTTLVKHVIHLSNICSKRDFEYLFSAEAKQCSKFVKAFSNDFMWLDTLYYFVQIRAFRPLLLKRFL